MNDLTIFFPSEIRLIAHVCDRHLIVAEGTFAERTGVVAGTAIELEQPTAGQAIIVGHWVRSRRVDGHFSPEAVVPADGMWRGRLAARGESKGHDNHTPPPLQDGPLY